MIGFMSNKEALQIIIELAEKTAYEFSPSMSEESALTLAKHMLDNLDEKVFKLVDVNGKFQVEIPSDRTSS